MLDEQRGAGQQPARVAPPESRIRLCSEQPECRPERLSEPGRHLDRSPLVLSASERRHDRPGGSLPTPDEYGGIAGCPFEDDREIRVGLSTLEQPRGCVEQDEIDVVLDGQPHSIDTWLARRIRGYAGLDASLRESVSALGQRGVRGRQLSVVAHEPSQDELARRPPRQWLRDREQVVEPARVGRDDHDRPQARRRGLLR